VSLVPYQSIFKPLVARQEGCISGEDDMVPQHQTGHGHSVSSVACWLQRRAAHRTLTCCAGRLLSVVFAIFSH